MGVKRPPGAKRTASRTSSKASSGTSSSTIGPNATNAANKGFFSVTDQQTATVLFLLDAVLLIGAVVIFITKPTCKVFGSEIKDDVGADGEKIEIQFFGHHPPPFNQFQGSSSGSIKYGGGWLSWPSGNGGNSGFKPPAFVPAVLPPTSYNPWRPTQPSWWPPPYMPPTYPSYPMYPPSYPSYPRPPTYPSYPSYPLPPSYPSYPSQPRPPTYPSYPSHPLPPSYPSYPSQPRPPTYPSYPSHPLPPSYPSYPSQPRPPTYPSYPSHPLPPTYPSYPSQPRPPSYPSYPSHPLPPTYPSYPSQPRPPTYPSYPSHPPPPSYPSYPSQPRPPTYPSNPSQPQPSTFSPYRGALPGEGASSAGPKDQISNTNFQCGIQQTKPSLRSSGISSRIIGGTEATPHSWPWIVAVHAGSFTLSGGKCGGTIVSPRHIITAGHCVQPYTSEAKCIQTYFVVVGQHGRKSGKKLRITRCRIYPYYVDRLNDYDLTIFTLQNELQFGPTIQPACLPPLNSSPAAGRRCWAYGWGKTSFDGKLSQNLLQVSLPIISLQECQKTFRRVSKVQSVCAGGEIGKDTCQGDSGGSLTCQDGGKWVLYGATSYGAKCATGLPGVYAATAGALPWLCCFMPAIPSCRGITCDLRSIKRPPPNYGR